MSLSRPEELLAHELSCPICLQLFSDPVVLPCGHNYCLACIRMTADSTDKTSTCCPECREEFQGVESLKKNFKLCSIIEGYQAAASSRGDEPAAETGLLGAASPGSGHLQRHQEKEWDEKSCPIHRRPLEYFCSDDMSLMCGVCFAEGRHCNHDVLTFDAAGEEMRRALENRGTLVSQRLQMTESLLQMTAKEQGAAEAAGDKLANKAVTVMESMATLVDGYRDCLRGLLEEERNMRRKIWQVGLEALEEHQQQLVEAQQSVTQVLSETDTCIFMHRFILVEPKLREVATSGVPCGVPSKAQLNPKRLQAGLKTQDFRSEMTRHLDSLHILMNPLELTFNLCSAHPNLLVSSDQYTVKYSPVKQPYPDHPERFTSAPQILCTQGLSGGEHVWVVEVGVSSMWSMGVCYKSIPRRGDHSRLGHNSVSWRLQWKNSKLTVCNSSCNVALGEMGNHPLRVEVALDYEAGTLMFHNIRGRREHLHTFRAVFREPVYPAFSVHSHTPESWITLQNGV